MAWAELCSVIEPHYPKAGNGRPPVGLERMLRMYFVQHWFNPADAACEDVLLYSPALHRFVGIDLGRERVPDATTLLHQTRKVKQWFFGMKRHIGVDSTTGLAHSAVVTAANVRDKHPSPDLLHGHKGYVPVLHALGGQQDDAGALLKPHFDALALRQHSKLPLGLRIQLDRLGYSHRPPPLAVGVCRRTYFLLFGAGHTSGNPN